MALRREYTLGYSEYWRKNKSAVETKELGKVMLALRKVGRHIASNIKIIEWSRTPGLDPGTIGIDLSLARGKYPVPPGKMDFLVALTAREAFHCKILSDVVWLTLSKNLKNIKPDQEYILGLMVGIGEDIFTKRLAEHTVWKHYLPTCWAYVRPPCNADVTRPPTVHTLLYIFADYVFLDKLAVNMHPGYHDLFQRLLKTRDMLIGLEKESSISKRCSKRADIYIDLWHDIIEGSKPWEPDGSPEEIGLIGEERSLSEDEDDNFIENRESPKEDSERRREAKDREQELLQTINEALDLEKEKNLNRLVLDVADDEASKIIDTTFGKASLPCRIDADPALVLRLRRIFLLQKSLRSRRYHYNRGLLLGKIDGRRLFRFPLDGRFFREKEYFYHDNTRNIVILVDGSASMTGGLPGGGKEWSKTEKIFVSLFEAVKGTGNRLNIYAYYERAGVCELNSLAYNNRLYTVRPGGRTPTGQAIVATAHKMLKDKRRLIVHLTDGEANCGLSVQKGIEFCDKGGVEIVTLGTYFDEKTKKALENQYQDRAILVDSLDLLPSRLEDVLRASLLK